MSKFYETPQFKKLQKKWYNKIKKLGFVDVEKYADISPSSDLKFSLIKPIEGIKPQYRWNFSNEKHFRIAQNFLTHGTFASFLDQKIWECYCEGLSIRQTVKELHKIGIKYSRFVVNERLKNLKVEMLIFNCTSEEGIHD
jgi:hypothetical protein